MLRLIFICPLVFIVASATEVSQCPGLPFPDQVKVEGCDKQPCTIIKGKPIRFELDFVAGSRAEHMYTNVRAKVFGIYVNYPLPEEQKYACDMLLYSSYCPIYAGEDVTYRFDFDVGTFYPEIGLSIEISLKDSYNNTLTCFNCDIVVRSSTN